MFVGDATVDPVITDLIRDYQLVVTILHGSISQTQKGPYGALFIHVDGNQEEIDRAISYLDSEGIHSEVITTND